MSFQIRTVFLVNDEGDVRRIDFRPGALNIVTGASKTGKSSMIDIVDYCLGSSDFGVAAGVVRQSVAIYGVVLMFLDGEQLLLARPRPEAGKQTTTAMHLSIGVFDDLPAAAELSPNTDAGSVRDYLSARIGIDPIRFDPDSTGRRPPIVATIRHSLYYVFQGQGEVANPSVLFHSQSQEWAPRAIRDTMPYFLGAVDPDYVRKRQRLRTLTRNLQILRRESEDTEIVAASARARGLVSEAQDAGLIEVGEVPLAQPEVIDLLVGALERDQEPVLTGPDEDAYSALLDERDTLRQNLSDVQVELHLLDRVVGERTAFEQEATEQAGRLASLGLVGGSTDDGERATCPVCSSRLDHVIPSVEDFREALSALSMEIAAVRETSPRLTEVRGSLTERVAQLKTALGVNASRTRQLESARSAIADLRDEAVRRAQVRGRVSLYLDAASRQVADAVTATRRDEIEREIAQLEEDLAAAQVEERLESCLSIINREIAAIAQQLQLEHSEFPVRFELRRLTVVADTPSGPVTLSTMGSGENWLGYHVAVMLALQSWFIQSERPVPRFLVFDQPSQVYFPPDSTGDEFAPDRDEDRAALVRVLSQMQSAVERSAGSLQVIVLDHADLSEDWFASSVVERWRGGDALVPEDWCN